MRTYTVGEAAALAGCSKATMVRLKQKGVLEGGRGFVKAPNRQVLAQTVEEATKGRHGWKWRERGRRTKVGHNPFDDIYNEAVNKHMDAIFQGKSDLIAAGTRPEDRAGVKGMLPALTRGPKLTLEPPTEEDRRQYEVVRGLRQWVAFPPARRELLLTLANHYDDAELQLLVALRSPHAMRLMKEYLRTKG